MLPEAAKSKINALDVIDAFVHLGVPIAEHGKLQKLTVYAQFLAAKETGKPLFADRIKNWQHGFVVPLPRGEYDGGDRTKLDDVQGNLVARVYEEHGGKTFSQLRTEHHRHPLYTTTKRNEEITPAMILGYEPTLVYAKKFGDKPEDLMKYHHGALKAGRDMRATEEGFFIKSTFTRSTYDNK